MSGQAAEAAANAALEAATSQAATQGEQKPGEQKPGEQKPGEQKPGEQKPGEQKPGEEKPGEQKPGEQKPGEQKPGEPPAKYELSLPESTALDQSDVDAITAMAKARGWTNDQAQAALQEAHDTIAAQRARFRTELEADPDIGGTNLQPAQQNAVRVIDRFLPAGTPKGDALRAALNKTGYGDWAPLATLLANVGAAMGEDRPPAARGGQETAAKKSHAEVLFGDAKK